MLTIKVLGPGCNNCKTVEARVRRAVENLGADANIEKVSDYSEIVRYGVLSTPGIVMDEKVVCAGRVPTEAEIGNWVADRLAGA
jgi:small redox-active disulfide protein 2